MMVYRLTLEVSVTYQSHLGFELLRSCVFSSHQLLCSSDLERKFKTMK